MAPSHRPAIVQNTHDTSKCPDECADIAIWKGACFCHCNIFRWSLPSLFAGGTFGWWPLVVKPERKYLIRQCHCCIGYEEYTRVSVWSNYISTLIIRIEFGKVTKFTVVGSPGCDWLTMKWRLKRLLSCLDRRRPARKGAISRTQLGGLR